MAVDFSLFKKHPALTIGTIAIGAFVFYQLALADSGESLDGGYLPSVQSGGTNELPTTMQQQTLQAQAYAQDQQLTYNAWYKAADDATKITLANLQASTSTTQQTNAITGQVQLATLGADVQKYGIDAQKYLTELTTGAQTVMQKQNLDAQENLAKISGAVATALATISADTVLGLGSQQSQTQIALGGYNRDVTVASINAGRDISIESIKARSQSSTAGFFGGLIGALL